MAHPSVASPVGGAALAAAAAAAAEALAAVARAAGDPGSSAQAQALHARIDAAAAPNADASAAALGARDTADPALRQEQRDFQIGRAFAHAAEPPLELARAAVDLAQLALQLGGADAAAAAAVAAGVARGAVALVAANLTALPGDPRVAEAERLAEAAAQSERGART
jgi:hypothetical protein